MPGLELAGQQFRRFAARVALLALASKFGVTLAAGSSFDAIRSFIERGGDEGYRLVQPLSDRWTIRAQSGEQVAVETGRYAIEKLQAAWDHRETGP